MDFEPRNVDISLFSEILSAPSYWQFSYDYSLE